MLLRSKTIGLPTAGPSKAELPRSDWPLKRLFGCGSCRVSEVIHIVDADGLVRLERALEIEFLGHLAQRRKHLLPQQADTGLGVLVRHIPIIPPNPENAGPRLFEQDAQFGDHLLWRSGNDHQIFELFFELR